MGSGPPRLHADENRVTLLVKWMFAVVSQARASMLLTRMPSQHMGLDAPDAAFPMAPETGPSIAEPGAALRAAMDYYSNQVSGRPTQTTDGGSSADSAAAIQ